MTDSQIHPETTEKKPTERWVFYFKLMVSVVSAPSGRS
nr:MAG TPA: hypothetical protein [Caudoviricetes sp.]